MPPRSQENAAAAPRASFSPRKGSAMEQTKREILPIKEQIARHRWKLDNRSIPMGIGCAEVSEYYGQGSEGSDLLLRCYEEGFRYFDTSRSYGNSELVVGEFLRQIDRKKTGRIRVATSDGLEQVIILGGGALRESASEFRREVEAAKVEISRILEKSRLGREKDAPVARAYQEALEKKKTDQGGK